MSAKPQGPKAIGVLPAVLESRHSPRGAVQRTLRTVLRRSAVKGSKTNAAAIEIRHSDLTTRPTPTQKKAAVLDTDADPSFDFDLVASQPDEVFCTQGPALYAGQANDGDLSRAVSDANPIPSPAHLTFIREVTKESKYASISIDIVDRTKLFGIHVEAK
ncbi:hypothetical protein BDN67DRAFT_1015454 [Paxillus ammoniavirescens]|nr:hypothetical protein BDN67DRAFT_1015454 [Paxillus ammoniavirescens]